MPEITDAAPTAREYCDLRVKAGLSPRTLDAAERGLAGGLFAVSVRENGKLIGMGRVIGDGGSAVQITDIAVDPEWQGQGLGRAIVARVMAWCEENLPDSCYLSLIADPPADKIYATFGFDYAVGMGRHLP